MRWNWYLTNVPNIAGKAAEKRTAVATVPVAMKSIVRWPLIVPTSEPNPKPNARK